ncbi:MAG: YheC/YheD family protein [Bacillota bacterium]|nr:YheC/YheD family protein [Bacillota bacterium]
MNIYYDHSLASWFHEELSAITFGGEKKALLRGKKISQNILTFPVKLQSNHAGPLIGIMAGRKKNNSPAGNIRLFIKIQEELLKRNGISFIFAPDDVRKHSIEGLIYDPVKGGWFNVTVPYPDIVYNRIPYRRSEAAGDFRHIFERFNEKKIPFFNPFFIDKYELYLLLNEHPILKNFLPATIPVNDKERVHRFFNDYKKVYLKTTQSSRGKGIFQLAAEGDRLNLYQGKFVESFENFEQFWDSWGERFQSTISLVQEAILPQTYDGKRFDFRILAHADFDTYMVTGIGVRQSIDQEITTHVPNGGKVIPYEKIQTPEHDLFVKSIVENAGSWLTARWGFFGEFSIDAGISQSGHYYLYEINSKPMSFDEPEIEERKIQQLCRLFLQLSQFPENNDFCDISFLPLPEKGYNR